MNNSPISGGDNESTMLFIGFHCLDKLTRTHLQWRGRHLSSILHHHPQPIAVDGGGDLTRDTADVVLVVDGVNGTDSTDGTK